ncbi:transcriptional regulator, LysR family [plant metagenome]|uniref:Transcriptional regulator, LysR family n=1 Tax=plant metagenome TaxID=1297885 RepID=A0A484SP57_9ZZZZ
MIDSRLLEVFAVTAEELHFGRAAQRLHLSQPPLSQSIKRLEEVLGARLFERSTRSVRLTPAGAELHRRTKLMAADHDAMLRAVQQTAKGETGQLLIGLTPSSAYSNLPQALLAYRERFPGVMLDLQEMNSSEMPEALHQRRLDLALLRPPFADADLAPEAVYDEPMVLAVRHDHALAGRQRVTMRQALAYPLVGYSRSRSRYFSQVLRLMIERAGVPAKIVQESMIPTILLLVEAGMGAAVVPASLARMRMDILTYIGIRGAGAMRAALVAARHPDNANPAIDPFLQCIRRAGKPA